MISVYIDFFMTNCKISVYHWHWNYFHPDQKILDLYIINYVFPMTFSWFLPHPKKLLKIRISINRGNRIGCVHGTEIMTSWHTGFQNGFLISGISVQFSVFFQLLVVIKFKAVMKTCFSDPIFWRKMKIYHVWAFIKSIFLMSLWHL